jgi:hypothetical protein
MTAVFPSLPSRLQVQALETMALVWRCDPPRHDISLEAISEALLGAEQLLIGAQQGRWAESELRSLEARIAYLTEAAQRYDEGNLRDDVAVLAVQVVGR